MTKSENTPKQPTRRVYSLTMLHDLPHWPSAANRCFRELGKRFGDQAHAIEVLIVELEAAFPCFDLTMIDAPRTDHVQYPTTKPILAGPLHPFSEFEKRPVRAADRNATVGRHLRRGLMTSFGHFLGIPRWRQRAIISPADCFE